MTRIIFHIDVNSAYLSWTAISLLKKGEPTDLRTIPSIIGGRIVTALFWQNLPPRKNTAL